MLKYKAKMPWVLVLSGLISLVLLAGCGNHLLGGEEDFSASSHDLTALLSHAESAADYQNIVNKADVIIADSSASSSNKQIAYAAKGEAQLGVLGISVIDVFADLAALSDSDSTTSVNIFNLISSVDNTPTTSLAIAVLAFNKASDLVGVISLAGFSPLAGTQNVGSLTSDQELTRGIANLLMVINIVKSVYDISPGGVVTANTAHRANTSFTNFSELMTSFSAPDGTTGNITTFAHEAVEGLTNANALSPAQLQEAEKINPVGAELNQLKGHVTNFTTYTYKGTPYSMSASVRDANIDRVLPRIFGDAGN